MRSFLAATVLSFMLVSPALAAPCPNLNVVFVDNLSTLYQVDHDNCIYKWDASNHNFNYDNVLKYVAIYNSEQITAIVLGGYWAKWLTDIQENEGYFDNVLYLKAKGL